MSQIFLFFIYLMALNANSTENYNDNKFLNSPYVLLISIDGYRHDYTKLYNPPNISSFIKNGIAAKALLPIYPTKTFPNHFSIVTGLYPNKHGIVSNDFYDKSTQQTFKLSDREQVKNGAWYKGHPLWLVTNKNKMNSASFFWVGSDANIQDQFPTFYKSYDQSIPNEKRVEQIIEWLKLDNKQRPHFLTLYFSDVDSAGHDFGPNSNEVKAAVLDIDKHIGNLVNEIDKLKLDVNVIIVSDHGMEQIKEVKYLEDYIVLDNLVVRGGGSHTMIYTKSDAEKEITINKLKSLPFLKVYRKNELPSKLNYNENDLIGDIVLSVKSPFYLMEKRKKDSRESVQGGTHGYEVHETPSMKGIFYAKGPQIKKQNKSIPEFENVHIYPFILKILGLSPLDKIDGDLKVLEPYLSLKP